MIPDHYQALGVHPGDDPATIRAAYLRVMRAHHPDLRPGDPAATEVAQRANAAWAVLGDARRRAAQDRMRSARAGAAAQALRGPPTRLSRPHAAYSAERAGLRRAFQRASLKVGAAVVAAGAFLLVAVG
jgi:curved DNA-binding protein CbpA